MIREGKRIELDLKNGESAVRVLLAIAMAAYEAARQGEDALGRYDPRDRLDPLDAGNFIEPAHRRYGLCYELIMLEVRGRAVMLHVAPDPERAGFLAINEDLYEGSVEDLDKLLLRAQELLPGIILQDRAAAPLH